MMAREQECGGDREDQEPRRTAPGQLPCRGANERGDDLVLIHFDAVVKPGITRSAMIYWRKPGSQVAAEELC